MRVLRRVACAGVIAASCVAGLWVPSALAAPAWLAPFDLSSTGDPQKYAQVATDEAGDVIAVWTRGNSMWAAVRPAGGSFSGSLLSAGIPTSSDPQVAMNAAGDAVAVWVQSDGANSVVQGAVRPAGGSFSTAQNLSAPGRTASVPQVAIDKAGNAVAVWVQSNGANSIVQQAVRPAGGSFSAGVDLSAPGQNASVPQVAMNEAGNAVAVWVRSNGANSIVQQAVRPAGGSFSTAQNLSAPGQNANFPQVAIDVSGNTVAVWERFDGANDIVQGVHRAASGTFELVYDISKAGHNANFPQVAMDPAGQAIIVWTRSNGANDIVQGTVRDNRFLQARPTVNLSAAGQNANSPQVAVNPLGKAIVVWTRFNGANDIVQGAVRPANGSFSDATNLSNPGRDAFRAQIAMDAAGNAIAVWQRSDVSSSPQAAAYDGDGPLIRALSVPATGSTNHAVFASVNAFDVWSPLAPARWKWGDGSSATDRVHYYYERGTYDVFVTVADTVGNTTSSFAGSINIAQGSIRSSRGPVVSGLTVNPAAFRADRSARSARSARTASTAVGRGGGRISYTLNIPASVRLRVLRVTSGRRAGSRCVAPTRANRRRARCNRYTRMRGTITRARRAGRDRFTFSGSLAGHTLPPGRYRLQARASAKNHTGPTTSTAFRIRRR